MSPVWQSYIVYRQADTYYVRGNVDGQVVRSTSEGNEAIQYALDASAGGGEVVLQPGEFVLAAALRLPGNVRLRGSGRGTMLRVSEQAQTGIIGERAHGASVTDLTLTPALEQTAKCGIRLSGCGNCTIDGVLAAGFDMHGIWLNQSSFLCKVSNCHLAGNGKANLFLEKLEIGEFGNFIPNLVTDCTIFGGGTGIEALHSIVLNIVGCQVYQTHGPAFHIHSESNSVLISGCRSFQITGDALVVEDTDEFNLTSNILCWHTGNGVVIRRANWGALVGNEIIDTGSYNSGKPMTKELLSALPADFEPCNAIDLDEVRGYSVAGNTIFNWPVCPPLKYGIVESSNCFKNMIASNNINYYKQEAVASAGKETVVGENVGFAEAPHQNRALLHNWMQTFEPQHTSAFIDLLKAGATRA